MSSSSDHTPSRPSGSTLSSSSSSSSTITATSSSCSACGKRSETSPYTSASKKPKIDDNSMTIELDKFLECSNCLNFPSSPIHSCANAHILCGPCAPKFVTCPTCQLSELRPSPLGEKLAKEANKKIACVNFEAGCKDGILSTEIVDHLATCYFRDISCNYKGKCGVKVKFQDYAKHLEDFHGEEMYIGPKVTELYRCDEKRPAEAGKAWLPWGQFVIKFRSHEFIVHAQMSQESDQFYSWVSVMGDKDLGGKFLYEVNFKNSMSDKMGLKWTVPVLAFHELPSNQSEAELCQCSPVVSITKQLIRNWGKMDHDDLCFNLTYKIKDA